MVSRTERNKKLVRGDILQWLPFPVLEEIKNWYGKIMIASMVSRTGNNRNETHEDILEWLPFPILAEISGTGRY